MMKERVKELFDLDWIKKYAEDNIDYTDWIEECCEGKRKVFLIETLVSSYQTAYAPGLILDMIGKAEGFDLVDPYNWEKNATIHDELAYWENKINDCLNKLLPSKGRYYVGYHKYDKSYCLFYEEYEKEEQEMKRVYKLDVYEIVNFDGIETLEDAEYNPVAVIEGSTPSECFEKATALYDTDRFAWSNAY